MTDEQHYKAFYSWDNCQRCNGTGWVKIAECYCGTCKRRYIKQLETMVADCVSLSDVMKNGYCEPLLEHVRRLSDSPLTPGDDGI